MPVGGGAGTRPVRGALGVALRLGDGLLRGGASGDTVTVPRVPSTSTIVPARDGVEAGHGDDARECRAGGR